MKVTQKGTVSKPKTVLHLETALERYAVRAALKHDAFELKSRIAGMPFPSPMAKVRALLEARLKVCELLIESMDEVSPAELEAEALRCPTR